MKNYWDKAVSFEAYLEETHHRIDHPKTEEEAEKSLTTNWDSKE